MFQQNFPLQVLSHIPMFALDSIYNTRSHLGEILLKVSGWYVDSSHIILKVHHLRAIPANFS